MHLTTKEVITDKDQAKELRVEVGCHILTTVIEADGPFELATDKAKFEADVISVKRTASGGVEIQTAFHVHEPQPEKVATPEPAKPLPTADEEAAAYLKEKGLSDEEAKAAVERFGAAAIFAKRHQERDAELNALLAPPQKPQA
jgi:hypothetical protein